jgi:hypothetical protein
MWDRVLEEFSSTLEKGEAAYLARAKSSDPPLHSLRLVELGY